MYLKFWKSKSTSTSVVLPVTTKYPLEKPGEDDKITGEEPIPLVIVEGFGGGAGDALWGDFANHLNAGSRDGQQRKTHFVKWVLILFVILGLAWTLTCVRSQSWTC